MAVDDPDDAGDNVLGFKVTAGASVSITINGQSVSVATFFSKSTGADGYDVYTALPEKFDGSETVVVTASVDLAGESRACTDDCCSARSTGTPCSSTCREHRRLLRELFGSSCCRCGTAVAR